MRNLYLSLGIATDCTHTKLQEACEDLGEHDAEYAMEASAVMLSPVKRETYDSLHAQFAILERVLHGFNSSASEQFVDTNHWKKRLVEFSPDEPATLE